MDTKRKVLIFGAAALIVMGVVVAAGAAGVRNASLPGRGGMGWGDGMRMHGGNPAAFESLGLPANATPEDVGDAIWEKQLKDLGLTGSSTLAEYRQALKARMEVTHAQMLQDLKARLNLPADATEDDTEAAMHKWRTGNKTLTGGGPGGRGFGRGPGGCVMGFGPGR